METVKLQKPKFKYFLIVEYWFGGEINARSERKWLYLDDSGDARPTVECLQER